MAVTLDKKQSLCQLGERNRKEPMSHNYLLMAQENNKRKKRKHQNTCAKNSGHASKVAVRNRAN